MKKQYIVGETIGVPAGNPKIAEGKYVVTGIGKDVIGSDPSKYKTIYQCTINNRAVTINEADLTDVPATAVWNVDEGPVVDDPNTPAAQEPTDEEKAAIMGERSKKYDQYLEEHPIADNASKKEKAARIKAAEDFALA